MFGIIPNQLAAECLAPITSRPDSADWDRGDSPEFPRFPQSRRFVSRNRAQHSATKTISQKGGMGASQGKHCTYNQPWRAPGKICCATLLLLLLASSSLAAIGSTYQLTPDGAWTWFNDPRALVAGNRLVTGWVTSSGFIQFA